jgi:hypothetical protein
VVRLPEAGKRSSLIAVITQARSYSKAVNHQFPKSGIANYP